MGPPRQLLMLVISICFAGLGAGAAEPEGPKAQPAPRSAAARAATRDFEAALLRAEKELAAAVDMARRAYDGEVAEATEAYAAALDKAMKAVLRAGDLDEANRIKALEQAAAEAVVRPGPGTGPAGPVTYLSDLEVFDVDANSFGKKGWGGRDIKSIRFKGAYSPNGIGMVPNSNAHASVRFDLGGKSQTFKGRAAVADSIGQGNRAASVMVFKVIGDGKVLHTSRPLQEWHDFEDISVSVKGVRKLHLRVDCPGHFAAAHAVWIEPRVLQR